MIGGPATTTLFVVYVLVCLLLFVYGINCYALVLLGRRRAPPTPSPTARIHDPPYVTIQLPVYNEKYVLARLVQAAAEMDWPRERFEVQILDDSDDETREEAARLASQWRERGVQVQHIVRDDRRDYKAGALRLGLEQAHGAFVAIFDADFIPPKDFLLRAIPSFADAQVACVQGRWTHVNADYSWLTSAQALGIDGHFVVEQQARSAAGLLMNFNGTAGVWRRTAIEDAGNWAGDTLAEDLDLSYRAQLRGWRIVFRDDLAVPAEIPVQLQALKRQQFRWAKGSTQCARKHLGAVLRSPRLRPSAKLEAVLHLTHYAIHPLMVLLLLLLLPLMLLTDVPWLFTGLFLSATLGPWTMYAASQRILFPGGWGRRLRTLVPLTLLGIGISFSNARAVLEGAFQKAGAFQRTPKFRVERRTDHWRTKKYVLRPDWTLYGEAALCLFAAGLLGVALATRHYFVTPWILLFLLGFGTVFLTSWLQSTRDAPTEAPQAAPARALRAWDRRAVLLAAALAVLLRVIRGLYHEDFSQDGYHHWWLAAHLAQTGQYADPFANQVGSIWVPAYDFLTAGFLWITGLWNLAGLRIANALLAGFSTLLVARFAEKEHPGAGVWAALLFAILPYDIVTSGVNGPESLAVLLALGAANLLLHPPNSDARWQVLGATAIAVGCLVRYETWVFALALIAFVTRRRGLPNALARAAPALGVMGSWTVLTLFAGSGFFAERIYRQLHSEFQYHEAVGFIAMAAVPRVATFGWLWARFLPVVILGAAFAAWRKPRQFALLVCLAFIVLLAAMIGLGITDGSPRYLTLAAPFLCVLAAQALARLRQARTPQIGHAVATIALLGLVCVQGVATHQQLALADKFGALLGPNERAGEWLAHNPTPPGRLLVSESPQAAYLSHVPPAAIVGSKSLPPDRGEALDYLRDHATYVVFVNNSHEKFPFFRLGLLFPELARGQSTPEFELMFDANDWERSYGAQEVYVYRVR